MKFILSLLVFLCAFTSSYAQDKRTQLIYSGNDERRAMNYDKAIFYYEKALAIDKKENNKPHMVYALMFIGESYISQNNMDKCLATYLEALKISETIKADKNPQLQILANISFYFMKFQNLDKAKEYMERARKLMINSTKSDYSKRKYFNTLGLLEKKMNNFNASIEAYKSSLEFIEASASYDYLLAFMNIADSYYSEGDYKASYRYLKRAETFNDSVQDDYWSIAIPMRLGRYYARNKEQKKALDHSLLGLKRAEESQNHLFIKLLSQQIAQNYADLRNYEKAYEHHLNYLDELVKTHEQENSNAIAEMEAKYEHEKKERKIKSLEQQKALKSQIHKSEMERRNLWILIVVIGLIVTLLISILIMKNQHNRQRLKLELVENQKEIAKQQSELKGQELERNRLSRELHDGLGGTLASIKMRLSSENTKTIQSILKDIDAACVDVRNMSHSLSSTLIEGTNFHALMTRLCDDVQIRVASNIKLEFAPIDALNNIEIQLKHHCYRIVQELTNNIIKHAQAKEITIGLVKNENEVILLVEDDGIGFNIDTHPSGIGLNNVKKRLKEMNGRLELKSTINQGTNFTISFPYKPEK